MDRDKRSLYAVVLTAIILLLLLWRYGRDHATVIHDTTAANPDIVVNAPIIHYDVPPLTLPKGGAWDWMQTTNLSCGCDAGLWKAPIVIEAIGPTIYSYPSYHNIVSNPYSVGTTLDPTNFPVYVPPPLPTWWYSSVQGQIGSRYIGSGLPWPLTVIVTSTGEKFKWGYQDNLPPGYHDLGTYTLSDPDLYFGTKHFVHDPSKDKPGVMRPTNGG